MRSALFLLMLLGTARSALAQAGFPWKADDAPPAVAGVHLGDPRARLDSILGVADSTASLAGGATALTYGKPGLSVILSSGNLAAMVYLLRSDAGEIGGLRLGAAKEEVLAKWGDPSRVQDLTAYYTAGSWGIIVGLDPTGERVTQLGLGLLAKAKP
jgi:hypothetical protein